MNKLVLAVVGGVVVLGAGAIIITSRGGDNAKVTDANGNTQNVKTGEDAIVNVDACDVLTEAAAKQVVGAGAEKGDLTAAAASTDDISVTNCVYSYKAVTTGPVAAQLASIKSASVLARSAKTKAGAESNKTPFGAAKPAGAVDVSGYGDKAYFNPQFGQLNVLKGGNWYILSNYAGTNPTKATLDEAKALGDAVKANLK